MMTMVSLGTMGTMESAKAMTNTNNGSHGELE